MKILGLLSIVLVTTVLSGCSTTNSMPYKASINNVVSIQQSLKSEGKFVSVGSITPASGVNESITCRLMGPVKVSPGKSLSQYVKDAFQEELFMAQVYSADSTNIISGTITDLSFSSMSPANWSISMAVKSDHSTGYSVSIKYPFSTSFDAYSACKNVANAFGPAVQELLKQVVTHPQFPSLVK